MISGTVTKRDLNRDIFMNLVSAECLEAYLVARACPPHLLASAPDDIASAVLHYCGFVDLPPPSTGWKVQYFSLLVRHIWPRFQHKSKSHF